MKKLLSASNLIAAWVLAIDTVVSFATIYLMYLCIKSGYTGALIPLTTLIGFCQFATGAIITAITNKKKAENTAGGIVYENSMKDKAADRDCS